MPQGKETTDDTTTITRWALQNRVRAPSGAAEAFSEVTFAHRVWLSSERQLCHVIPGQLETILPLQNQFGSARRQGHICERFGSDRYLPPHPSGLQSDREIQANMTLCTLSRTGTCPILCSRYSAVHTGGERARFSAVLPRAKNAGLTVR